MRDLFEQARQRAPAIDEAIRRIVMDGFDRATLILGTNRDVLERGAWALLDRETLDEAAIRALANDLKRVDSDGCGAAVEAASGGLAMRCGATWAEREQALCWP